MFGLGEKTESRTRVGTKVSFFQGRRAMLGTVEEVQEDGRLVVNSNGMRLVKDEDEIRAYSSVKGKKARIRFV